MRTRRWSGKPSPELTRYDEPRVALLEPVNAAVQALRVPRDRAVKLTAILKQS